MPSSNLQKQFHTFFKQEEWERIIKKSEKAKLKPTTYIKHMALFGELKLYDTANVEKLMLAINRVGNNINQIAVMANTTQSVYQTDVDKLKKDFQRISEFVDDYLVELEYNLI